MLILTIFSQKSVILDNFPFMKVRNIFSLAREKIYFFGRIFTYREGEEQEASVLLSKKRGELGVYRESAKVCLFLS